PADHRAYALGPRAGELHVRRSVPDRVALRPRARRAGDQLTGDDVVDAAADEFLSATGPLGGAFRGRGEHGGAERVSGAGAGGGVRAPAAAGGARRDGDATGRLARYVRSAHDRPAERGALSADGPARAVHDPRRLTRRGRRG